MKTVLIELLEELKEHGFYPSERRQKELLEKEKQQIIEAYNDGGEYGFNNFGHDAEKYFEQTFKNE